MTSNIVFEISQGNKRVFEKVFYEYHPILFGFVIKKTSSPYLAEEVVQQTFIKLWENRDRLSPEFSIGIQISRIARTTLIDLLRKNAVQERTVRYLSVKPQTTIQHEPILEKELKSQIDLAVNRLPPVCQQVFRLSREEGLTHKEIAQKLAISPKSVENHIAKALKLVRRAASYAFILSIIR